MDDKLSDKDREFLKLLFEMGRTLLHKLEYVSLDNGEYFDYTDLDALEDKLDIRDKDI